MSRLYENKPLRNLPLINIEFPQKWTEDNYKSGDGLIIEGSVKERSRFSLTDIYKHKAQYCLFHIEMSRVHRRKFDKTGQETESNFSETQKVSTGYLNSSYRTEAKGQTDRLSPEEAKGVLEKAELSLNSKKYAPAGCVSLWIREDKCEGIEIDIGDIVRVRTEGNSPFIFSIVKLDAQSVGVGHYAGGEQVGTSWTDKIFNMKSSLPTEQSAKGEVEDDEWDD